MSTSTPARPPFRTVSPEPYRAMLGVEAAFGRGGLDPDLLDLVRVRASQLNGCAFCLTYHAGDLRSRGEREERLYLLAAWREAGDVFTPRERAALAWAEAVTLVREGHVPDAVYAEARAHFGEPELVDLTWCVAAINTWNRLNIAFRTPPRVAPVGTPVPQAAPRETPHGASQEDPQVAATA